MRKIISIFFVLIAVLFCLSSCSLEKCDICDEFGAEHEVDAITTWKLCDDCYYDYLEDDSSDDYDYDYDYDSDYGYYQGSSFKNKYGDSNTICAHSGCTNYIASSGDTNCCSIHSNRCYECNCYIDEDASWCLDCLTGALS